MSNSAAKRAVIDGKTRKVPKQYAVVDGKNRKIYKSYAVVNGINRLCYMSEALAFTGEFSVKQLTIDSVKYDLYTITTGGVLSLYADNARFWICGGGGGGSDAYVSSYGYTASGGGGGGGYFSEGEIKTGRYPVVIGLGGKNNENGGLSSIGEITASGGFAGDGRDGGDGGSGGGHGNEGGSVGTSPGQSGNGYGLSTVPFSDLTIFGDPHCGAGGGGSYGFPGYSDSPGGKGGSNGSNGADASWIDNGGIKGGGNGGRGGYGYSDTPSDGKNATYYGSGGGGGGANRNGLTCLGGKGYQGVLYLLVERKYSN